MILSSVLISMYLQVRQTFDGGCPCLLIHAHLLLANVYVLGVDSLVRSLKEALQLTNLEVPKQGLLLLTEILER